MLIVLTAITFFAFYQRFIRKLSFFKLIHRGLCYPRHALILLPLCFISYRPIKITS
ncbi:hypothetical protein VCCP103710_3101 [Vibrio cholerae CP1037(10)]|nr:hypothetical protein VCCP103710_3101 [Vibrio cholerae CP1037(10)]